MFMVSYDVTSLSETIDLAVNAIFERNTGLDLKLFSFNIATSHTVAFMIKSVDGVDMGSP